MKVRGTSDFTVTTTLDQSEVLAAMQHALDNFRAEHLEVLEARVERVGELNELRVQIVLRSDTYGAAEDLMSDLGPRLASAIAQGSTSALTRGVTELLPA